MPLKKNRQLLLAKVESSFNVDASPTAGSDAIQVEEPDYQLESVVLERNFIKPTFDRTAHAMGRKLAKLKFVTEVKNGGAAGTQSRLGRLLTGCGLKETLIAAPVTGTAQAGSSTSVTLAVGASANNNQYSGLKVSITAGAGNGSYGFIIGYNGTTKVATVAGWSGTAPDNTSTYSIEAGASYRPSSDAADHKSLTFYLYKDGLLHVLTGCYGTVMFDCAVNGYGKATFEFTGQYYAPTDSALPSAPTYESTVPQQVELAELKIDSFAATCSKFSLDAAVTVLPRLDANGADGYNGTYIDDRDPKGGIDPESVLVASYNFWSKLATAAQVSFVANVGTSAGNICRFGAAKVQYTGLTYASRDNLQTLDAGLAFNGNTFGDDEYFIALA